MKKLNRQEALAVTSLIAAAIEQPEYQINEAGRPVSFGVVSLVGDEQALAIDSMLRSRLSPDGYELHRLLCGNAAQFQGDERDVVFISLVDTAERGPLRLRDQQLFKQRFNVAASRARDQMWIVHSLNPDRDLKDGDLRRQLIEHAYDPSHLMRALNGDEGDAKKAQSPFERAIMKCLEGRGYHVTPHWRVGKYRIDMVVEGNGQRLAVECEGDPSYPIDIGKLPEDMERQAILERLGWVFTRIRATEFLRDAERAMNPVFEKLNTLEITPEADVEEPPPSNVRLLAETNGSALLPIERAEDNTEAEDTRSEDLVARVIRRADELRQEWVAA
jgi:very-short-patch-repair endonuclease